MMTEEPTQRRDESDALYLERARADRRAIDLEAVKRVRVRTERVERRLKAWEEATPWVSVNSSIAFTRSWKETEGLHKTLRWAKAFESIFRAADVSVREGELIVGSLAKDIKGVDIIAAFRPRQILHMLDLGRFYRRGSDSEFAQITAEDAKLLREDAEYWVDHMPPDYVNTALRHELGEEHFDLFQDRAMVFEGPFMTGDQERGVFQDYGSWLGQPHVRSLVVDTGLNAIIEKAKAELERVEREGYGLPATTPAAYEKYALLKSMIISCEAVKEWAGRHAALARSLAEKEADGTRKGELEKIAEICDWVPANPPRTFWEAVQSLRFLHLALWKEQPERADHDLGMLDQILYPYYERDLREGRIIRQEAAELTGCFWLKVRENETMQCRQLKEGQMRPTPGTNLPQVVLCGRDRDGKDATSEMSALILEVMRQMRLSEPATYVRYHGDMDDEFLLYALECNRDVQGGNPSFLNHELGTARYLDREVEYEDAVDWVASGCLGNNLDCAEHASGNMSINMGKVFEITLHNGVDPRTKKRLGLETGDVTRFTSADQLKEAFLRQAAYFVERLRKDYFIRRSVDLAQAPDSGFCAAMYFDDSIRTGRSPLHGGSRYPFSSIVWIGDRGLTDVADCLAAVKQLVFEQRGLSMAELLDALRTNWEGHEGVKALCLKAPKYGNDDDYVDELFNEVSLRVQGIIQGKPDPFTGQRAVPFRAAGAPHMMHGSVVGALPNGRTAGAPLNDAGTSAMAGMDVKGPTALINSATKVPHARELIGITHNMKLHKQLLTTPKKLAAVMSLMKVFFERGGWHIQFNMHDPEELLQAKEHPEEWKHLIVRVAGYNAYFVDLPGVLQDEIIARTLQHVN